jgi:phosphoglycerol transferase MdoB-like AlkP superfamily enzyme
MRRVLKPLWILLAVIFLVEAWLWEHLRAAIAWVVNLVPLDRLKVRLAAMVEKLPPWAVLIVFVVPFIVLLPLKFLEVYFIVRHRWLAAILVLLLAKLLGLGVTAFIFDVTKPKLLQMAWFRWLFELMLVWLAKAHAITDPIKLRIKEWFAALKHRARKWIWLLKPGRPSRFLKRLARIRRRVQTQPAE